MNHNNIIFYIYISMQSYGICRFYEEEKTDR